jgi:hypothetical protein
MHILHNDERSHQKLTPSAQKYGSNLEKTCNFTSVLTSVVDRHRFDADPDPYPNFQFDADPDPDSNWHQNDADPNADPTLRFTHIAKTYFFTISCLQCFILLISVKDVIIFSIKYSSIFSTPIETF